MSFQLTQRLELEIFFALKVKFKTNRKINIDNDTYCRLSLSNKKDIQEVINFFSFSNNHPLLGLKLISYRN